MPSKRNRIIALVVFLIIFATVIGGILSYYLSGSPQPVTVEQINDALISHDLPPVDITDEAQGNFPGAGLLDCIAAEQGDIHFEFYNFDNSDSALQVYREAKKLIISTKMATPRTEIETGKANYKYYSLAANGDYSVTVYVANTAVYAYSDKDNQSKIIGILETLGYIDAKPQPTIPEWATPIMRVFQFVLYMLFIGLPGRSFLWQAAYVSAGISRRELENMEKPKKELSHWFVEISPRAKLTNNILTAYKLYLLPGYLFIALSVVSFFTAELNVVINAAGVYLPLVFIVMFLISVRFNKSLKENMEV